MGITFDRTGYRGLIGLVGDIGRRRSDRSSGAIQNIAKAAESGSLTTYGAMPTVDDFAKQLASLGDVDSIDLYISSEGGDCLDCLGVYNLLSRHKAKIYCVIDGIVAGSSVIPCMAADKISIGENAHIALRCPELFTYGDSRVHRAAAEVLGKLNTSFATTIARRSGRHVSTIQGMMNDRAFLTGTEAVEHGLADRLLPLKRSNNSIDARLTMLAIHDRLYPAPPPSPSAIAARLRQIDSTHWP